MAGPAELLVPQRASRAGSGTGLESDWPHSPPPFAPTERC